MNDERRTMEGLQRERPATSISCKVFGRVFGRDSRGYIAKLSAAILEAWTEDRLLKEGSNDPTLPPARIHHDLLTTRRLKRPKIVQ